MIRIKLCGITTPEDGVAAAQAGADAIGLIFVPGSPRCLDIERARQILAALPPLVTPVAVFMDAGISDIRTVTSALAIRTVQLHGQEPVAFVKDLAPLTVIKALSVPGGAGANPADLYESIRRWSAAQVGAILLDKPRTASKSDAAPMPWRLLAPEKITEHCGQTAPLILAGGLDPDNVTRAVQIVRPYGVDVASGVERGAGVKDHDLIQRFIFGARNA